SGGAVRYCPSRGLRGKRRNAPIPRTLREKREAECKKITESAGCGKSLQIRPVALMMTVLSAPLSWTIFQSGLPTREARMSSTASIVARIAMPRPAGSVMILGAGGEGPAGVSRLARSARGTSSLRARSPARTLGRSGDVDYADRDVQSTQGEARLQPAGSWAL